jgi:hypothetical protein
VSLVTETAGALTQLFIGSTDVTSLAVGPGYVTPPLAAAKFQALTLKITPPVTAQPAEAYFARVQLTSVDGVQSFGDVEAGAVIGSTVAGTTDHDILATSAGQPTIRGSDLTHGNGWIDAVTAPTIKVGGIATFTLTLKNDSTDTTQMLVSLDNGFGCSEAAAAWSVHLKFGSTDVTSAAIVNAWISPATAPAKTIKLILTAKALSLPTAAGCRNFYLPSVTVHGLDPSFEEVFLLANVV